MRNPLTPEDALTLIDGALERLEVMKVLLSGQCDAPVFINLSHRTMSSGLRGIFDSITEDIGEGHLCLEEAMKKKEAEGHAK